MAVFKTGAEKRKSYDYRRHYLQHNRGLLGSFYFCSQCGKPLMENELEVDHIFPNSKWFSPNRTFNCVAICPMCNKRKSNKISFSLQAKGIIAKLFEEFYILIQKIIIGIIRLIIILMFYLLRLLWSGLLSGSPIRVLISVLSMFLISKYVYTLFV